jgi:hypothetical protein
MCFHIDRSGLEQIGGSTSLAALHSTTLGSPASALLLAESQILQQRSDLDEVLEGM